MPPDTAPLVPVMAPSLSPRGRFAVAAWDALRGALEAVLEASSEDRLPAIHAALVLDADTYAAQTVEMCLRPYPVPENKTSPRRNR